MTNFIFYESQVDYKDASSITYHDLFGMGTDLSLHVCTNKAKILHLKKLNINFKNII